MNPEIASLDARMANFDWFEAREEIARLHQEAETREEYVTLLDAHHRLVAIADQFFAPEKCAEIRQIASAEYRMFLSAEAMEKGNVNPALLDKITLREVESGRLSPDDDYRQFAAAGGRVLGDSADLSYDRKLGDVLGGVGIIVGALAFFFVSKPLGVVLIVIGIGAGWFINNSRRKQALKDARSDRLSRGYE